MSVVNKTILSKLTPKPHFAISGMVTLLLPKITAFVPVPDGNINEKEQANVAGIISNSGFIEAATAIDAKTGRKIFAVAVLLLISVIKIIRVITMISTISDGNSPRKFNVEPR